MQGVEHHREDHRPEEDASKRKDDARAGVEQQRQKPKLQRDIQHYRA